MKTTLFVLTFIFSSMSLANFSICIDAYAHRMNPFSGHAAVAFYQGNNKQAVFGYYPETIGNAFDDAFINEALGQTSDENTHRYGTMNSRGTFCKPISRDTYLSAPAYAEAYIEAYPRYNAATRNCATFAIWMYERLTGEDITAVDTPTDLAYLLRRAHQEQLTSLDGVQF